MGYSCKCVWNQPLINLQFGIVFSQINILQVVMFQNLLVDPKISKGKQISLFFSMSSGVFVSIYCLLFTILRPFGTCKK
jgi:hypothetical protein